MHKRIRIEESDIAIPLLKELKIAMISSNESTDSIIRYRRKRRRTSISSALPTAGCASLPQAAHLTPSPSLTQVTHSPSYPSVIYTITSSEVPTHSSASLGEGGGRAHLTPSPIPHLHEGDEYGYESTLRLARMEADRAEQAARDMESALKEILLNQASCSEEEDATSDMDVATVEKVEETQMDENKGNWNGNRRRGEDHTIRDVEKKEQEYNPRQASVTTLNPTVTDPMNKTNQEQNALKEPNPKPNIIIQTEERQSNVKASCEDSATWKGQHVLPPVDTMDTSPIIGSFDTSNHYFTLTSSKSCGNDDELSYDSDELSTREPLNKMTPSFNDDLSCDDSHDSSFFSNDDGISYKSSFERDSFCQDSPSFVTAITVNTTYDLSQSLRLNTIDTSSVCSGGSTFHTVNTSLDLTLSIPLDLDASSLCSKCSSFYTVNSLWLDTSSLCGDVSSFHTMVELEDLWDSRTSAYETHNEQSPCHRSKRSVPSYTGCVEEDRTIWTTFGNLPSSCQKFRKCTNSSFGEDDTGTSVSSCNNDLMSCNNTAKQQKKNLLDASMRSRADSFDQNTFYDSCTFPESDLDDEGEVGYSAGDNRYCNRSSQLTDEDLRRLQIPHLNHRRTCVVKDLKCEEAAGAITSQKTESCNMQEFLDIVSLNSHVAEVNAKIMDGVVSSLDSMFLQESEEERSKKLLLSDEELFFSPFLAQPKILDFSPICETLNDDNNRCVKNDDVLRETLTITSIMEPAVQKMNQMVVDSINEFNLLVEKYESMDDTSFRWFAQVSPNIEGCYYYQSSTGKILRDVPPEYCDTGNVRLAALEALESKRTLTKLKSSKRYFPTLHCGSICDMLHDENIDLDLIRSVYPRNPFPPRQKYTEKHFLSRHQSYRWFVISFFIFYFFTFAVTFDSSTGSNMFRGKLKKASSYV